jgi:hypothetical protein
MIELPASAPPAEDRGAANLGAAILGAEKPGAQNQGAQNQGVENPVAEYKRQLQHVCDNRPSGTRGRLAQALGTNRSFVSQLVNPAYAMPIPAQHLETIFEVCHLSPAERAAFLASYDRAHPGRRDSALAAARTRLITLAVPDLGHPRRNRAIEEMIGDHARQLVRLVAALES